MKMPNETVARLRVYRKNDQSYWTFYVYLPYNFIQALVALASWEVGLRSHSNYSSVVLQNLTEVVTNRAAQPLEGIMEKVQEFLEMEA